MLMIMACIYVPDGVSLPSTIDLASSLLIDGLGHMHEGKYIQQHDYTYYYIVIFSNHIVQSNRVVLGLTRLREMARLTVWSVNKAGCFVCVLKRERNMGYLLCCLN